MGCFTAAGMIVMLGRLGAAAPTAGFGLELDAIVAVVIGGASFRGGEGRLRDTAIGVLFLAVLNNGLSGLQMGDAGFFLIKGTAILAALTLRSAARFIPAGRPRMTAWPAIDFGHTPYETAVLRGDVYGIRPDAKRAAKRPLRLAIVGCGGVAQAKWLPAIRYLQTRSRAGDDRRRRRPRCERQRARSQRSTRFRPIGRLAGLLAAETIDLALVLSSDDTHVAVARGPSTAVSRALVEKPLSRSARGGRSSLHLRRRRRACSLPAVANKRFSPPYALAQALVQNGALKVAAHRLLRKVHPRLSLCRHPRGGHRPPPRPCAVVHGTGRDACTRSAPSARAASSRARSRPPLPLRRIGTIVTSAAALSFKPWERVEIIGRNAMLVVEDQYELTLYDDETGPAKSWRRPSPTR